MSSAICSSCKWSRWSSTYCVFYKNNISLNIRYCPSYRGIPTISCEVCGKRTRTKFVGENYFRCLECGFYLLTKEGKVIEILDEKEFKKVLQKFKKPESKTAPATSLKKEELKYELFRKLPCGCRSIKVIFPDGDYVFSIRFCELHSRKGMSRIKREIEKMLTTPLKELEDIRFTKGRERIICIRCGSEFKHRGVIRPLCHFCILKENVRTQFTLEEAQKVLGIEKGRVIGIIGRLYQIGKIRIVQKGMYELA